MTENAERNVTNLAYGIEHLQIALRYVDRGRKAFFDEKNPDTRRLVESELRKAYESLNRLGPSFWNANPSLPRDRVGEIRQLLTHDYSEVGSEDVWRVATAEARPLLRRLARTKVPLHTSA